MWSTRGRSSRIATGRRWKPCSSHSGEFKERPLIGAAVRQLQGGCKDVFWPQETKKMIKAAGVEVTRVKVDADGTINIT